ncbi:hypothetical protein, partial [Rhizobium etli]|uniref:hypothetical protein n=1 Tax=Rhizobium etli TaxID=29449 RepID=UPI001AEE2A5A
PAVRTPADGHPPECAPIIQQSAQIEHARGPHCTPFIGALHCFHQFIADIAKREVTTALGRQLAPDTAFADSQIFLNVR